MIYQVYPRSFQDSNGDGVGDLRGITYRLGYLAWLGVDAVWISPVYPSPMADFGYDISNYKDVHPMFGTLKDFDALVAEAHRLGLKVILDFVPNHTSDEHPWFVESRSSQNNPKRDWYIWCEPAPDSGPPNNWISVFGGSAWEFESQTGQYYYHAYLKEQPDLNWRNPEVREAMLDVMRFWLERGVDGFRVDTLRRLFKDKELRDDPPNPDWRPGQNPYDALLPIYTTDQPEVHRAISEMRRVIDSYGRRDGGDVMVGELHLPLERLVTYYGENLSGVHLPSNMHLISTPWNARQIAAFIDCYEAALPSGAWPNWVLGNHDRSRIASRVGVEQARVAAMLLLTLRGTPTIYYGDEIGMHDVSIPSERVQDPVEKNVPGLGLGRDPGRTPMQWDGNPNAGFCPEDIEPWLPVAKDHTQVNVSAQTEDPDSTLNLYRHLLGLRRAESALSVGSYEPVAVESDLLAYRREYQGKSFLIILNLGHQPLTFQLPEGKVWDRVELSTHLDRDSEEVCALVRLRSGEGLILKS